MPFQVRRVYDLPRESDGTRVLVDRLWLRGIAKDKARIDLWLKDVAPSNTQSISWPSGPVGRVSRGVRGGAGGSGSSGSRGFVARAIEAWPGHVALRGTRRGEEQRGGVAALAGTVARHRLTARGPQDLVRGVGGGAGPRSTVIVVSASILLEVLLDGRSSGAVMWRRPSRSGRTRMKTMRSRLR